MREVIRTNNLVLISWIRTLLSDSGIETVIFDVHMSVLEGSAGAIQQRLMVQDEFYDQACENLIEFKEEGLLN
ncbi:MAG: DUF2007 domain-containing protein [Pseudomonadota bacterium]|nr:DUF2007 domain-containing protein [Pseudomonadota bacterium]